MSPQLVGILAAIASANARVAAMQAHNAQCAAEGRAPSYGSGDFFVEAQHLDVLSIEARNAQ